MLFRSINASNVDPVEAIRELTGGGAEYTFEAVGLKKTAEQSFESLRAGGTATIIGMVPFGQKIELHGYDFLRERKIQGSSMGSNRFRVDMPKLLNFWKRGDLKLDHLITGHIKLDDQVHVSVKAWKADGSKMFIQEGSSVRLEDIMRGVIIQSGNDAAIALAEHIAGSEEAFADLMNQHARVLDRKSTRLNSSH